MKIQDEEDDDDGDEGWRKKAQDGIWFGLVWTGLDWFALVWTACSLHENLKGGRTAQGKKCSHVLPLACLSPSPSPSLRFVALVLPA